MRTVNIHTAKTQLSRLIEAAAAGEEIIIAKAGRPIAQLVPLADTPGARALGVLRLGDESARLGNHVLQVEAFAVFAYSFRCLRLISGLARGRVRGWRDRPPVAAL